MEAIMKVYKFSFKPPEKEKFNILRGVREFSLLRNNLSFLSFHITHEQANQIKCIKERHDLPKPEEVPN